MSQTFTYHDFESAFGEKLSPFVKERISKYNLSYSLLSQEERDSAIRRVIDILLDPNITKSGEHRLGQWETGWGENLTEYTNTSTKEAIIPKYFGKYPILRWKGDLIKSESREVEYHMLGVLLDWLFDTYIKDTSIIYEFGCGTGHNLLRAREFNPKATLWGLDWATSSQDLINKMRNEGIDQKIYGHRFDYFHPDTDFKLEKDSIVYTVASLEQIGDKHQAFVTYLLENKPKLCIHIEPIAELLDESKLIDYLAIQYFKKRNYLSGYLDYLRSLEKKNKLTIHQAQRSNVGSYFVDGYSVIVWSPK